MTLVVDGILNYFLYVSHASPANHSTNLTTYTTKSACYKMKGNEDKTPSCQVWLITGCSSGLGRQLVLAALARGDKVVATARRLAGLEDLPESPKLKRLELDVNSPESSIQEAVKVASNVFGKVDVLVNNAGFVVSGVVEELGYGIFPRLWFQLIVLDQTNSSDSLIPMSWDQSK